MGIRSLRRSGYTKIPKDKTPPLVTTRKRSATQGSTYSIPWSLKSGLSDTFKQSDGLTDRQRIEQTSARIKEEEEEEANTIEKEEPPETRHKVTPNDIRQGLKTVFHHAPEMHGYTWQAAPKAHPTKERVTVLEHYDSNLKLRDKLSRVLHRENFDVQNRGRGFNAGDFIETATIPVKKGNKVTQALLLITPSVFEAAEMRKIVKSPNYTEPLPKDSFIVRSGTRRVVATNDINARLENPHFFTPLLMTLGFKKSTTDTLRASLLAPLSAHSQLDLSLKQSSN